MNGAQRIGLLYRYADVAVSSPEPLDELCLARNERNGTDFAFSVTAVSQEPTISEWLHHWRMESGTPALSLAKTTDGFLLRFPDLADFIITADGRRVCARPVAGIGAATLRHLLLDQVLPRLLAYQGRTVLHASAVEIAGRAVAFVGQSRRGKSTLAAGFYRGGHKLLCDDGLVLSVKEDHVQALPTYPGLRLRPDVAGGLFGDSIHRSPMAQYSSKQRLSMKQTGNTTFRSLPLAALYLLASKTHDRPVSMTRISPRDACMAIIANSFQLDVTDRVSNARVLNCAAAVVGRIPAFELSYPHELKNLSLVRCAILKHQEGVTKLAGERPATTGASK